MRWALLAVIRAYWRWRPRHRRAICLFRETCSRHVYRVTRDEGLRAGLAALGLRIRRCRPGFVVLPPTDLRPEALVLLHDGAVTPLAEMAPRLALEREP